MTMRARAPTVFVGTRRASPSRPTARSRSVSCGARARASCATTRRRRRCAPRGVRRGGGQRDRRSLRNARRSRGAACGRGLRPGARGFSRQPRERVCRRRVPARRDARVGRVKRRRSAPCSRSRPASTRGASLPTRSIANGACIGRATSGMPFSLSARRPRDRARLARIARAAARRVALVLGQAGTANEAAAAAAVPVVAFERDAIARRRGIAERQRGLLGDALAVFPARVRATPSPASARS